MANGGPPMVETRGIKVPHAADPSRGAPLGRACWNTIDLPGLRSQFER